VFVQTIHALSEQPQPDPIVVLPGGPGDDASHARNLFYRLPAREDRDFILIDPRGTGYSEPNLNCMENGGIGFAYDSAVGAAKDCYERLQQEGIDFAGYTTAEQVTDVVDLAQALGLSQINLHGGSYGTRVAIQVADRYAELVRSMMLDGVMPVNVVAQLEEPVNVYNVFRKVFADCAADAACNAANPDLMNRMLGLVDRYNAEPFPEGVDFAESGTELVAYISGQIYSGTRNVPAFVTAMHEEDFARACTVLGGLGACSLPEEPPAAATVTATLEITAGVAISTTEPQTQTFDWRRYFTDPDDPYGSDAERVTVLMRTLGAATPQELFARLDALTEAQFDQVLGALDAPGAPDPSNEGVYYSVWCSEEAPFYGLPDVQNVTARIPAQFGAFPTARATELKDICNLWVVPPVSAAAKVVKLSYVPTLIVNGTHDPITPPMWAKRAAAYMENVHVELFPGFGHVILSTGNDCMAGIMSAFYSDPTQEPDDACLNMIRPQWLQ
jgi:pimeloyl-ACP methyl ester carboxylesterase